MSVQFQPGSPHPDRQRRFLELGRICFRSQATPWVPPLCPSEHKKHLAFCVRFSKYLLGQTLCWPAVLSHGSRGLMSWVDNELLLWIQTGTGLRDEDRGTG